MAVDEGSYEDCRRKRLEENKKRMEELKLTQLSQTLKNASPKPSPVCSSLISKDFCFFQIYSVLRYKRRDLPNRVYASNKAIFHAIERANEVQSNLESEFPSFIKPMLILHVTGGFWLGLPVQFCKSYLPVRDNTVTLFDEHGDEYQTVYLAQKTGLSGGWRGFSLAHDLVDGDALVFQLVKNTTVKVCDG
ncbi:hypothetical protein MRB53_033673 [Persea americana]|uniref:Uncharacterized protein n=1 Tax=Persea americana TaxID=3435 RepID=A0ACC2KVK1_PERAE|nr:hypothetical protein MRB53_033673 [Persea americana]